MSNGAQTTYIGKFIMDMNRNEQRKFSRRTGSTGDYIDSVFNVYSKVLAVRVDFYYNLNHPANAYMTDDIAKEHMDAYLNNYRSYQNLGDLTVGYVIRLECAEQRGLHFHCLFLLDGQRVQNEFYYAQLLGNYWLRTLSNAASRNGFVLNEGESLGSFNICDSRDYSSPGIGLIEYHDDEKIHALKTLVIAYQLKPHSNVDGGFWKGQMKQPNGAGRSRLYQN